MVDCVMPSNSIGESALRFGTCRVLGLSLSSGAGRFEALVKRFFKKGFPSHCLRLLCCSGVKLSFLANFSR